MSSNISNRRKDAQRSLLHQEIRKPKIEQNYPKQKFLKGKALWNPTNFFCIVINRGSK